jgi:hypothetical protein
LTRIPWIRAADEIISSGETSNELGQLYASWAIPWV